MSKREADLPPAPSRQLTIRRKLSLAQLMLWIAGIAVYLGVFRAIMLAGRVPDPLAMKIQTELQLQSLLLTPFIGAALAGIMLWLAQVLARQSTFPVHPGHWLLLIAGFQFLVLFATAALAQRDWLSLPDASFWWQRVLVGMVSSLGYLTAAALAIAALVRCREPIRWRIYFATVALAQLMPVPALLAAYDVVRLDTLSSLGFLVHFVLLQLAAILLLVSVLGDYRQGRSRDFPHWAGVMATIGDVVVAWIAPLAFIVVTQTR